MKLDKLNPLVKLTRFDLSRRDLFRGAALGGTAAALGLMGGSGGNSRIPGIKSARAGMGGSGSRVAADPTNLPSPITRTSTTSHSLSLDVVEKDGEIAPGVTAPVMTFGGQIPGPMLRVMEGDTVYLTLNNLSDNAVDHNIDLHAVYGPGGGADDTLISPGQSATIKFKAMYAGCYIYHCAVPDDIACHIAHGMYGLILVEPDGGLPAVDRELYLGQHEYYDSGGMGDCMGTIGLTSDPDYVAINGAAYALTSNLYGPIAANKGETVRIFFGNGGPNRLSSFHPIGNVMKRLWRDGNVTATPEENVQTVPVSPGSAIVTELELPVPGPVKLVDHAISTLFNYGALAVIDVDGTASPDIYEVVE